MRNRPAVPKSLTQETAQDDPRALHELPGIVSLVGANGTVIFANAGFEALPRFSTPRLATSAEPPSLSQASLLSLCEEVFLSGRPLSFVLESQDGRQAFQCEFALAKDRVAVTCVQVTSLVQSLARSRRSESLLTDAQGVAHLGTWEWDIAEGTVHWSDELYRIYGITREQDVPSFEGYLKRVHPDDRERVRETIERVAYSGDPFSQQERIVRPDGSIRYLRTWGIPTLNDLGKPIRMLGACLDETDRKTAELELQKSNAALRATLDSTADGILVVDRANRVTGFNQLLLDLWQLPAGFLENHTYQDFLSAVVPLLKAPQTCLNRLEEFRKQPGLEGCDTIEFNSGKVYERYSRPLRLGDQIIGRVFSYRDVTVRRHTEEVARLASDRMSALVDASRGFAEARLDLDRVLRNAAEKIAGYFHDGCIVRLFTADRRRLHTVAFHHVRPELNEWMERLLGRDQLWIDPAAVTEMLRTGKPVLIAGSPDELRRRVRPEFWPALDKFPIHSWILVPLRLAGKEIGTVTVFRFEKPQPYSSEDVSWLQEVCERAAISINNAQLYQDAQRAIELREDFMSIASHELKTPLTPLRMQLQLLAHLLGSGVVTAGPLAQKLTEVLSDSDQQIGRLARLVEDILDATRLRTGRLSLRKEEVDLGAVVSGLVARHRAQLLSAACPIDLRITPTRKGCWDRQRIEQVVTNLLTNAMKFGAGRPIEVRVYEHEERACFSVRDFGIGIDPKDHERIFERLERLASAKQFGGLGMGLFIAREIVEAHDGAIRVESSIGRGAVFTVELPLWNPEKPPAP